MKSRGLFIPITAIVVLTILLFSTGSCQDRKITRQDTEKEIKLPQPDTEGKMSVEKALKTRRSIRSYKNEPFTDKQISQLLWAAQGVTLPSRGFRTAPSAGATYPLETYAVTSKGIFKYIPRTHRMKVMKSGDFRKELQAACMGQSFIGEAGMSIVFCAVYSRTTSRYGDRAKMYVHMEAGHAAQNIHLQAVAMNLGSVPVGAFNPDKIKTIISSRKNEIPIYVITVGHPTKP